MSAQAVVQEVGARSATRRRFQFRRRHLWWVPGLAIAILASQLSERHGLGILPLIAFQLAPHLPTFLGRRAVRLFNVGHHPVPPLVLAGVAVAAALPAVWLVAGLAWLSHVVIGWGIGDGMRPVTGRGS